MEEKRTITNEDLEGTQMTEEELQFIEAYRSIVINTRMALVRLLTGKDELSDTSDDDAAEKTGFLPGIDYSFIAELARNAAAIPKPCLFDLGISESSFSRDPENRDTESAHRAAAEVYKALAEYEILLTKENTRSRANRYTLTLLQLDTICKGKIIDAIHNAYKLGFIKGMRYEKNRK